jgi:hypothetical protein
MLHKIMCNGVTTEDLHAAWASFLASRPLPTADPRPELVADHALWAELLPLAHGGCCGEVFWTLQGLRCMGAGLSARHGRVELWRGKMSEAEYSADRAEYLVPNGAEIKEVLGRVRG